MEQKYISLDAYNAMMKSTAIWANRRKMLASLIGKPISERKNVLYCYDKRLFELDNGNDPLCKMFIPNVCTGCPLRYDRKDYYTLFTNIYYSINVDLEQGQISQTTVHHIDIWVKYMKGKLQEYTWDKSKIEKPNGGYPFDKLCKEKEAEQGLEVQLDSCATK